MFFIVFLIALVVFFIVTMWKVFEKAGRPGWACIVPIYNTIVQLQVAKLSPWLVFVYLLTIIPIVGFIVAIILLAFLVYMLFRKNKYEGSDL